MIRSVNVIVAFLSMVVVAPVYAASESSFVADRELVTSVDIRIIRGLSTIDLSLAQDEVDLNPIIIELVGARCSDISQEVSVGSIQDNGTMVWTPTTQNHLGFIHDLEKIRHLRFYFNNAGLFANSCRLNVYKNIEAATNEPNGDEFLLLGTIHYRGGFINLMPIQFRTPKIYKEFLLAVPNFCNAFEIMNFSALTNSGELIALEPTEELGHFVVPEKFHAVPLKGLRLSANGPVNLACQIPLFGR